jgi:ATP-dependent Clp protease adapter protein ClpS
MSILSLAFFVFVLLVVQRCASFAFTARQQQQQISLAHCIPATTTTAAAAVVGPRMHRERRRRERLVRLFQMSTTPTTAAAAPAVIEPPVEERTVEKKKLDDTTVRVNAQDRSGTESWEIRLFNDPMNKREFVARCLQEIVGLSETASFQVMMQAHRFGLAAVGRFHLERAELYRNALVEHGLTCDMVKVDDE